MRSHTAICSLYFLMVGTACVGPTGEQGLTPVVYEKGEQGEVASSGKTREADPDATDVERLVADNSAFGLDFYRALRSTEQGNLLFSPFSISLALAMAYAGARAETETQMASALRFTLHQERLHQAFNALDLLLAGKGGVTDDGRPWGFQLRLANSLWGQHDYTFLPEFLDLLAVNYGAGMQLVDFVSDPEAARIEINDWVAEHTGEKILDLIPEQAIDDKTRLVLVNAIYFKSAWATPFPEWATSQRDFHLLDGGAVRVPMMRQQAYFRHAAGEGFQTVQLPYNELRTSMVLLVPDAGQLAAFEETLDEARLAEILGALQGTQLDLTLPRWRVTTSSVELKGVLTALGMRDAFIDFVADFSGMDGRYSLKIEEVLHKAYIEVNEAGTEAAAATAVVTADSSCAGPDTVQLPVLTVDRPFIYLIIDDQTGTILFAGRLVDPSA